MAENTPSASSVATDPSPPPGEASPARRLRDAIEPVAMVCYYGEPTERGHRSLGLDFFPYYVPTRSGPMGEVDAAVVTAAFGVWAPDMIARNLAQGRAVADGATLRAVQVRAAQENLDAALSDERDGSRVTAAVTALRRGLAAADVIGRPLFAATAGPAWPTDPLLALWHAATLLREYRGDSHVVACAAAGVTGLQANILTELAAGYPLLEYTATREWSSAAMDGAVATLTARGLLADGGLTEEGRRLRDGIETTTDRQLAPVLDAVGPPQDVARLADELDGWSSRIIEAGAFPDDPRKRTAG